MKQKLRKDFMFFVEVKQVFYKLGKSQIVATLKKEQIA